MHVRIHRLVGLGVAFGSAGFAVALEGSAVLAFLCAYPGATAPDWLEIPYGERGATRRSVIPHRTLTHFVPLWMGLLGISIWGLLQTPAVMINLLASASLGFACGALSHLALDLLTPLGVPLFSLRQRYQLKRFTLRKSKPIR